MGVNAIFRPIRCEHQMVGVGAGNSRSGTPRTGYDQHHFSLSTIQELCSSACTSKSPSNLGFVVETRWYGSTGPHKLHLRSLNFSSADLSPGFTFISDLLRRRCSRHAEALSDQTVGILRRHGIAPAPRRSQTTSWKAEAAVSVRRGSPDIQSKSGQSRSPAAHPENVWLFIPAAMFRTIARQNSAHLFTSFRSVLAADGVKTPLARTLAEFSAYYHGERSNLTLRGDVVVAEDPSRGQRY